VCEMEAQIFAHQVVEDNVDNYQTDVEILRCLRITMLRMQACLAAKARHCNLQTFKCVERRKSRYSMMREKWKKHGEDLAVYRKQKMNAFLRENHCIL